MWRRLQRQYGVGDEEGGVPPPPGDDEEGGDANKCTVHMPFFVELKTRGSKDMMARQITLTIQIVRTASSDAP